MPHSPHLTVTVDGAIVVNGKWLVLIRRTKLPFRDRLVLPGGHIEKTDATLEEACARELAEEVGLMIAPDRLVPLTVLNRPGADPRYAKRLSVVYRANITHEEYGRMRAGSDAEHMELVEIDALLPTHLGFDHFDAVLALRART